MEKNWWCMWCVYVVGQLANSSHRYTYCMKLITHLGTIRCDLKSRKLIFRSHKFIRPESTRKHKQNSTTFFPSFVWLIYTYSGILSICVKCYACLVYSGAWNSCYRYFRYFRLSSALSCYRRKNALSLTHTHRESEWKTDKRKKGLSHIITCSVSILHMCWEFIAARKLIHHWHRITHFSFDLRKDFSIRRNKYTHSIYADICVYAYLSVDFRVCFYWLWCVVATIIFKWFSHYCVALRVCVRCALLSEPAGYCLNRKWTWSNQLHLM